MSQEGPNRVAPRRLAPGSGHGVYHGMRVVIALAAAAILLSPPSIQAQKGTLTGTVRDTAGAPVADADVWTIPGARRTRTDTAGRFTIAGLSNDNYQVSVRKLGFAPEVGDAKFTDAGALNLKFTLRRRADLDTVRVVGRLGCDGFEVTGFECRRVAGGGLFLDYPEIDAKHRIYVADLFRDIPGFRVVVRPTRAGGPAVPVMSPRHPYNCIASYVDGRPANITNPIPETTGQLVAMEVYVKADSIPLARRADLRILGTPLTSQRCGVIVYWTPNAPV